MKRACETLLNHTATLVEELAVELRDAARQGRGGNIQVYATARIDLIQEYLKAVEKLDS